MRDTLWEAASSAFAEHHWYAQAAELGTRVYALAAGNRSEYALKIAEWELVVGNAGHARTILRDAVESDRGDTLEVNGNAVFAALRAYDLLLPENERAVFTEGYLRRVRDQGNLAHAAISAVLLHGLAGDERAAEGDLNDLLSLRMLSTMSSGTSPDARRWTYVLNNGAQLQAWTLDTLAAYYWRHALKETSAFEREDGDALNAQADIRSRLLGVEVAMASDPQKAEERAADYLRSGPLWDSVAAAASQLLAAGQYPAATRLYEALRRARPAEAEYWRNLSVCYESAGDRAALERGLSELLSGASPLPAGVNRMELAVQLASVRQAEGDGVAACRLVERAQAQTPGGFPILVQLAHLAERAGRWETAIRAWTDAVPLDPSLSAKVSLADAEEHQGHGERAIALLGEASQLAHEPVRSVAVVHLARLYVAAGRIEDARVLGEHLVEDDSAAALPAVAEILAAAGQKGVARELLSSAVRRKRDPRLRYYAQQALVALYATPADDLAAFTREMHRLEQFAHADPALRNTFAAARYQFARQRRAYDWLEGELRRAWGDSNGDLTAGENLVALSLETHRDDRLAETVAAIDHHPDLPEQMLHTLEEQLVQNGQGPLALPMLERLRGRFPQNVAYAEDQARAFWQAGRRDDAASVLERLDATSVFHEEIVGQAGAVYAELGDKARAREKFETAVRHDDPVVRYPWIDLRLAQFDLEDHHPADARHRLKLAYRNPTCTDPTPLIDYLAASEKSLEASARGSFVFGDFPLTYLRRAQLLAAIVTRLGDHGKDADARRWVDAHPELVPGAPGLIGVIGNKLGPADLPAFVGLMETVAEQTQTPPPMFERELAALYLRWAQMDAVNPGDALDHLARAHELAPDDFEIARHLATACIAQNQRERAVSALAGFLGPDALPDDRKEAQQTLGAPSSGASAGG